MEIKVYVMLRSPRTPTHPKRTMNGAHLFNGRNNNSNHNTYFVRTVCLASERNDERAVDVPWRYSSSLVSMHK